MRKKQVKKNIFREAFYFILDSKNFIFLTIFLFFLSFLFGILIYPNQEILEIIKGFIKGILEQTEGMSFFNLLWFIFSNNLKVSFISMIFGVFFGIVPFLIIIFNGYFVGFVSYLSVSQEGIFSLWKLLPHGIFELSAIFISLGFGFRLGFFIFEKREKTFLSLVRKTFLSFILFVLPLLLVAAIIESILIFYL